MAPAAAAPTSAPAQPRDPPSPGLHSHLSCAPRNIARSACPETAPHRSNRQVESTPIQWEPPEPLQIRSPPRPFRQQGQRERSRENQKVFGACLSRMPCLTLRIQTADVGNNLPALLFRKSTPTRHALVDISVFQQPREFPIGCILHAFALQTGP